MALISIRELTMAYLGPPLLDHIDCEIEFGDRIGLLGRNGAGKSTLLKILSGKISPDYGSVSIAAGTKVAILDQEVPMDIHDSITNVVTAGVIQVPGHELEDWEIETDVEQILSRMELDGTNRFESLSSGMKRRVLLARALVSKPDFLLLDEPTNHLDIDAIDWLEQFLSKHVTSFMFVTHDRMFLRRMANRILEIDRGRMFDWSCDYESFLVRKEQALATEEKENAMFDKRLAEEEIWIRKGIKARRTRNEGRVRALKAMRAERSERREKLGTSKLQIQDGQRSGNLVIALDEVSFGYQGNTIIDNFSTVVMRGDKIGIIGRNGAGKSTLLKLMLGQLAPTSGNVKLGANLQVAYFDQLREQLDENATVQDNVGDGYDMIHLANGKKHVLGYLQDFLFTPERSRTQVKFLSGGERNRILLAKLFSKPANLVVLDEPTNDLDAETLELLEDRVVDFTGTVLIVSHDRAFLNNVVTGTIVFEPDGLNEYVGGYDDWQRQYQQKSAALASFSSDKKQLPRSSTGNVVIDEKPRKLKYKEKMELQQLPAQIESLEREIGQLNEIIGNPEFYRKPKTEITAIQDQLKSKESNLRQVYSRWEELEQLEA